MSDVIHIREIKGQPGEYERKVFDKWVKCSDHPRPPEFYTLSLAEKREFVKQEWKIFKDSHRRGHRILKRVLKKKFANQKKTL